MTQPQHNYGAGNDANNFQAMMNTSAAPAAPAAPAASGDPLAMAPMHKPVTDYPEVSKNRVSNEANPSISYSAMARTGQTVSVGDMNYGGMSHTQVASNIEMPKEHSGTDHIMHSGLMMQGDAMQDFNLRNGGGDYELSSYISGNKYVVQDVVQREMEDHKSLSRRAAAGDLEAIDKLEGKIAKELTNVNDIDDIEDKSLRRAFIAEGEALGLTEKEMDHLLHTPISETGIGSFVSGESEISGSLHTVDLDRTRAVEVAEGTYEVHLVSNNGKNNAHDKMDISTFYVEADSAKEATRMVNKAAERGDLDKNGRYNLTDAGMSIMSSNLQEVYG
jgi:hypothetical protein